MIQDDIDELVAQFREIHKKTNSALILGFSRICHIVLDGFTPESLDEAIDFFVAAKSSLYQAIETLKLIRNKIT